MKIVTLVSGDARYDGRVLRATRSLRAAGHDVQVFDQGRYTPSAISRGAFLVRATRRALRFKPDVVHANDLDTLPAGIALKRLAGSRLVYDCHEFFFDMVRDQHREAVSRAFGIAEPILADEADAIIAANEGVRDYLETFLDRHVTVVHNYPPSPNGWKAPFTHKPFTLIYIGTFQRGRFLEEATHVVRRRTDIRMTIWGAKMDISRLEGGPVIAVRGMVDNERVVPLMSGAHAVLAMYDPTRMQNARGMPNKVYEAMAAGRPSIVSEGTAAGRLVSALRCGVAAPFNGDGLSWAIDRVMADDVSLGTNGYKAAKTEYNWEREERRLLEVYGGLA